MPGFIDERKEVLKHVEFTSFTRKTREQREKELRDAGYSEQQIKIILVGL